MSTRGPQRVVWSEGLLIGPEHMQQLDAYHERLLARRLDAIESLNWGVFEVELDRTALTTGHVQLVRFRGVMPDGTVLDLDANDAELPPARPLDANLTRALELFIGLPREREGVNSFAADPSHPARYQIIHREVRDWTADERTAEVAFGKRKIALLFGHEERRDFVELKIGELTPTDAGVAVVDTFVPACLRIGASSFLMSGLRRLMHTLLARQRALSEVRRQINRATSGFAESDITRYLLLAEINSFLPRLQHAIDAPSDLQPRQAYLLLAELYGRLCTFVNDADPLRIPKFVYRDLRSTFEELFARITELLQATVDDRHIVVSLQPQDDGFYVSRVDSERLRQCRSFWLAVHTDVPEPHVAKQVPEFAKITSRSEIRALVSVQATRGAPLEFSHSIPPEIPRKTDHVYFSIGVDNEFWRKILAEAEFALYLPPFFEPSRTKIDLLAVPVRQAIS